MRQIFGAATFALLIVLSASLAMIAVGPPTGDTLSGDQLATSTPETFTEESYNGRMYMKYVPSSVDSAEEAPLLVMLHGCTQSPSGFAEETKMNQVAEDEGFIVIYPDQTSSANQNECWNWFEDQHTTRGNGEAALIAGMTQETMSQHNVDDQRVYLAGFSAGGGMAPNMAAAYPDLYAAVGVAAGLEYDAAESMTDGFTVMSSGGPDPQQQGDAAYDAMGSNASPVPTAVWHGTADTTVDTVNGHQAAEQATQTNDWATDGTDDGNINYTAEVENSGQTADGVSYTEYEYHNEEGIPVVEKYIVEGMDHAWAGGMSGGSYTAPDAPDASQRMWNFFEMHTRDQVGGGLNQAPTAVATASSTSVSTGDKVTFDASGSENPDGTIESYEWDFDGDGTVDATSQQVAHTFDTAGTYDVTLRVTDDDGAEATSTVTITVEEFSGYCGSAYPYEHESNGRAVLNADGSYSAVGSGDYLGYGASTVTLKETSENYFEKVDSC